MCLREQIQPDLPAALVYEILADALERSTAAEIIKELKRTVAVAVVVDMHQHRHRVSGCQAIDTAHPTVPVPHFIGRHPVVGRIDSADATR